MTILALLIAFIFTFETDFQNLLKKRDRYQAAHIYMKSGDQIVIDTQGEIRSRGNMRKNICAMPPTKIRFDQNFLKTNDWYDYPTLKIINACAFNDLSETYVELEYLLYKIYNLVTENSFRVQRLNLLYSDTKGKKKPVDFNGFLLEHEDQLARRMDGKVSKATYFKSQQLDRRAHLVFSVFQFMIGNTDWKVLNKHNIEVIRVSSKRTCYPVPYDFDYAGVVHATYAVPHESLPISEVTERLYLGPCQTETEVNELRAFFLEKKDEIVQLLAENISSNRHLKACRIYFNDFFRIMENERNAKAIFMNCRDE